MIISGTNIDPVTARQIYSDITGIGGWSAFASIVHNCLESIYWQYKQYESAERYYISCNIIGDKARQAVDKLVRLVDEE